MPIHGSFWNCTGKQMIKEQFPPKDNQPAKLAATFKYNSAGDLLYASEEFLAYIGADSASGVNLFDMLFQPDEPRGLSFLPKGKTILHETEHCFINLAGTRLRARFIIRESQAGNPDCYEGCAIDITPFEKAIRNLVESRMKLQFALSTTKLCTWSLNLETNYFTASDNFFEMLGYKRDKFGLTFEKIGTIVHPDEKERLNEQFKSWLRGATSEFDVELRMKSSSGRWVWVNLRASIVDRGTDGKPKLIIGTNSDISERVSMLENLRQNEEKYRSLFNVSADAILLIDTDNIKIIDSNPAAGRIYGYTNEEFLRLCLQDISNEPDKTAASLKNRESFVPIRMHRKKDGTVFPVEIYYTRFMLNGKEISTTSIRDISERIENERRLRTAKEYYETLVAASPVSILTLSSEAEIDFASTKAEALFNCTSGVQLPGTSIYELLDEPSCRELSEKLEEIKRDNMIRQIDVSARAFNGRQLDLELNIAPLCSKIGNGVKFMIAATDINHRIRAEKQLKQSMKSIIEAEARKHEAIDLINNSARLASIGVITGSITHEVNQPLNAIRIGSQGVLNWNRSNGNVLPGVITSLLEGVFSASGRIEEIVRHIRTFWENGYNRSPRSVDLNEIVSNAVSLSAIRIKSLGIATEQVLLPAPCFIHADAVQLEMAISILISNAAHTFEGIENPRKTIKISVCDDEPDVSLFIESNGGPLPDVCGERLFDPFLASDMLFEGTGLSLAIVKTFTDNNSAVISAANKANAGTEFKIIFKKSKVGGHECLTSF